MGELGQIGLVNKRALSQSPPQPRPPFDFRLKCYFIFMKIAEALAGQVTEEHYVKGIIYPPFGIIRKISAHIAANVAARAYGLGECILSFLLAFIYFYHLLSNVI